MLWVIDEGKLFQKNGIDPQILYLRLSNGQETATAAVFIAIGFEPETTLLRGLVEIDPMGHAPVDLHMQTSVPGLFASVPRDKGALDRSLLYPATA